MYTVYQTAEHHYKKRDPCCGNTVTKSDDSKDDKYSIFLLHGAAMAVRLRYCSTTSHLINLKNTQYRKHKYHQPIFYDQHHGHSQLVAPHRRLNKAS